MFVCGGVLTLAGKHGRSQCASQDAWLFGGVGACVKEQRVELFGGLVGWEQDAWAVWTAWRMCNKGNMMLWVGWEGLRRVHGRDHTCIASLAAAPGCLGFLGGCQLPQALHCLGNPQRQQARPVTGNAAHAAAATHGMSQCSYWFVCAEGQAHRPPRLLYPHLLAL